MLYIIGCLSQKGGVGKSTVTRLLARTYAAAVWSARICDFNLRQLSSVTWNVIRRQEGIEPKIDALAYTSPTAMRREAVDVVIADGRAISETNFPTLNDKADILAAEIIGRVNHLVERYNG